MAAARILALDVGDKRIGLAITDELGLTAQPLFTLHRKSERADLKAVGRFLRQHGVTVVVVGNPLHADGSLSPQSQKALAFAALLRDEHPGLTHHLLDERLTTRDAHALLDRTQGRRDDRASRLERTERIDQVAAVLLLEAFLSAGAPVLLPGEMPDRDLV